MHAFRSPIFFQDAGCVRASMEWTPVKTGAESASGL